MDDEKEKRNVDLNDALSPRQARDLFEELKSLKELLAVKESAIEVLKLEVETAKQFELKLGEREEIIDGLEEELSNMKTLEAQTKGSLAESNKRIEELKAETEKRKASEYTLRDTLVARSKQLEDVKTELEESRGEIASLIEEMEKLKNSSTTEEDDIYIIDKPKIEPTDPVQRELQNLRAEIQLAKDNMARAQDGEKYATLRAKRLYNQTEKLENELKITTAAEEKSKKAMDNLAFALKEVATEANYSKEKLISTRSELEYVKEEACKLKEKLKNSENKYQTLFVESKREAEQQNNTIERLRSEADEALLAWTGKEMGFVGCIKKIEEEKSIVQHENTRLTESLKAAESMTRAAREESYKLRDILRQAVSEANAAKVAASTARDENSQLKDLLAEKDEAVHFLTRENERLRINEAAANENIKELKRFLSTASKETKESKDSKEFKELRDSRELKNDKNDDKLESGFFSSTSSVVGDPEEDIKPIKTFSFDLNEIKIMHEPIDLDEPFGDEDPEKAEALKGSIFDPAVETPKSEPHTPKPNFHHRRGSSSVAFIDDGETSNSEDLDSLDSNHFEDAESDKTGHRRRRSALLRRFGDLIMRKSFHTRKEPPTE
ncbi:hypothetical protein LguiA_013674 [Lonicera macranthoides]